MRGRDPDMARAPQPPADAGHESLGGESEQHYRTFFDAISVGCAVVEARCEADGRITAYRTVDQNAASRRMQRDGWEEWRGMDDRLAALYGSVLATGEAATDHYYDEQRHAWIDLRIFPLPSGECPRFAVLFTDITTWKRGEAKRAALFRLADLLRSIDDPDDLVEAALAEIAATLHVEGVGYAGFDPENGEVTRFHQLAGTAPDDLATMLFRRSFGAAMRAGAMIAVDDVAQSDVTRRNVAIYRSAGVGSFLKLPIRERQQLKASIHLHRDHPHPWRQEEVDFVRDAAERLHAAVERAEALRTARETEKQFQAFSQILPNLISIVSPEGEILWANERLLSRMGLKPEFPLNSPLWSEIIHPDDVARSISMWRDAVTARGSFDGEMRMRQGDGSWRWHIVRAEPLLDPQGKLLRMIVSATDIDDTRRQGAELERLNERLEEEVAERTHALMEAEAALRQSQKMEAVGQLTGGIAHDFNNILTGIVGSLEMLLRRLEDGRTAEASRYAGQALTAAHRAAALTHRLLAFSRRQPLDPRPVDLAQLVGGLEEMIRRTTGPAIAVSVISEPDPWTCLIDVNQLENALLNLCINARDAMPGGGGLCIETKNMRLEQPEDGLPPGDYARICVTDTGEGMTEEVRRKALEPFFTTKPMGVGTGLGLSTVYGFVAQSGGGLGIESEPGRGTRICLTFPRHRGAAEPCRRAGGGEPGHRPTHGETILVVDDEPLVRGLVVELLAAEGYRVMQAEEAAEALAMLSPGGAIDLLISDIGLPGGMNGWQLAEEARRLRPGLSTLFITGYAENAIPPGERMKDGLHLLTKPFGADLLMHKVRQALKPA